MITYLAYSTFSLGILILFYYLFLEKEKMYRINRGFLLFSLLFSFSIPLIPVGVSDLSTHFMDLFKKEDVTHSSDAIVPEGGWLETDNESGVAMSAASGSGFSDYVPLALMIYILISSILLIRLLRIIYMIQIKADRNERRLFKGCEIVLLNQNVAPHTFISTIFLNKEKYLQGEIRREVMIHELSHARQKHTLDILLVEFLKILFWFNPLLYLYKKAILLNHEFLADEAVIAQGTSVKDYQNLLLNCVQNSPNHGLASTFIYSLTKKRLQMMTQSTSWYRSAFKMTILIPLIAAISLLPGCESTTSDYPDQVQTVEELNIEITKSDELIVNREEMTLQEFDQYLDTVAENIRLVNLEVHPNAPFGSITDLQMVLREHGTLMINYSTTRDEENKDLEQVTNEYLNAANRYIEIDTDPSNYQKLTEKYEEILELYEEIQTTAQSVPDAPPPPPLVPSPGKRMMDAAPSTPIEQKNLMQILMNKQGMLLMNEKPVTLDDVTENIKQFVDNHGVHPDLSDNPNEAIVAIKTSPNTDYDLYLKLLGEVMAAYDKLRDEAAQKRYGNSYSALEESSEEREMIKHLYPVRISIQPPEEIE